MLEWSISREFARRIQRSNWHKTSIFDANEDFDQIAEILRPAKLICQDFEQTLEDAGQGDFVFIDPPYTTAHNMNGFVKYNQRIFSWDDQKRLRDSAIAARRRGAIVIITNAYHASIKELYKEAAEIRVLNRRSVISGSSVGRRATAELLICL